MTSPNNSLDSAPQKSGITSGSSEDTTSSEFDKRVLVIPLAAVVITLLCVWRAVTPRNPVPADALPDLKQAAPAFQLYDQSSTLVKLDAFLHRHHIVVVFYDGQAGPESNTTLCELREFHPALKQEGVIVVGVSTALPQENRNNASRPFPFPLLSDADAISQTSAHRRWGRFIKPASLDKPPGTVPGVFLIDRAGLVRWDTNTNSPLPENDLTQIVPKLLGTNVGQERS